MLNYKKFTYLGLVMFIVTGRLNGSEYFSSRNQCDANLALFYGNFFHAGIIGLLAGVIDKKMAYTVSATMVAGAVGLQRNNLNSAQVGAVLSAYVVGGVLGKDLRRNLEQLIPDDNLD